MSKSTAREGAHSISDKRGQRVMLAPLSPSIPLNNMAFRRAANRLYGRHEHDFAPIFDGAHIEVCSCGATRGQSYE